MCKSARTYLASSGVNLIEYNVGKDKTKWDEMVEKSRRRAVPVIDVEGTILTGFSQGTVQAAIESKRSP
ncbi:MAG TPA: NrdH-redoxin [Nitrospiraceae bacterium]|nr:NrdH-redoxin [Nitrospiraceae bacterium]